MDAGLSGERIAQRRLTAMDQFLAGQCDHRRRGFVGAEAEDIGRYDDLGIGGAAGLHEAGIGRRSEEHTSELQSLMRISYAVFCLKKKRTKNQKTESKTQTRL